MSGFSRKWTTAGSPTSRSSCWARAGNWPRHWASGSARSCSAEDERLAQYTTLPYARVLTDTIREKKPEIVLYGASPLGRDLAPRVASALKTGLTADCTDLQIGTYESGGRLYQQKLLQIRPAWGGIYFLLGDQAGFLFRSLFQAVIHGVSSGMGRLRTFNISLCFMDFLLGSPYRRRGPSQFRREFRHLQNHQRLPIFNVVAHINVNFANISRHFRMDIYVLEGLKRSRNR